ncbi:MAG: type IIL restriction-modification enzyme MmeI [Methylocella sp.]
MVRQAYDEWREALDLDDPDFPKIHRAWIELVLKQVLELDENGAGDVLKSAEKLPNMVWCELPEHGVSLRPEYAVINGQERPLMLIAVYGPEVSLKESLKGDGWAASPAERMVELCRATDVRLGLVTNGEQWMFVDAPVGAVSTFASWYARLWGPEPVTLQAFVNLLGVRRFFVDRSEQLPALLDNSLKFQDEVTDALGEQVTRAVEALIQALDRADVDRNRDLLDDVDPAELYEAGLTVMMRIVFLLSAEERGLLLLGDGRYEANYAVSTLRMQLRAESEEILERRWDAWSRLLSIFRAVYGGVNHEAMRLPALGGSLFDPDRFPFLEGRTKGSRWKIDPATPLPIDNRTVLYLLDAVQLFQGRTLSYLALDIEQIGYVYEGLLERTVVRAKEATLDLDATKSAKNPWVSLPELDDAAATGRQAVEELLKERTGSSASRVRNDLDKVVDEGSADKLLSACHADPSLRDRIRPYFHLLRTDRWGYPLVYPKDAFIVTTGADRRETGTHYTPTSFTKAIVKETLEPLVYVGPAEGKPKEDWELKSPAELLDLKICDPAMGSGAFLVQVCRWLSERLVEAWAQAEDEGKSITSEGEVVDAIGSREPLRKGAEERILAGARLIAERCLYGVDMNPLAVELAKLSIWLITLAKGRPFGFLDHNLRCGDSLLGITNLEQLTYLDMSPGKGSTKKLFASKIDQSVSQAIEIRSELRRCPIRDIRDVEVMARLDEEARRKLEMPELVADLLIGEVLEAGGREIDTAALAIDVGGALAGDKGKFKDLRLRALKQLRRDVQTGNKNRRPFHWPLEFPEVFGKEAPGFDAFVGNPPFLGGQMISGTFGSAYQTHLVNFLTYDDKSSVDLVVYFFLRVFGLLRQRGCMGLLGRRSISEGKNRETGLTQLLGRGANIYSANTNMKWPGKASVVVHQIHIAKCDWSGARSLNKAIVKTISADLGYAEFWEAQKLDQNGGRVFQGTILLGEGFKIDEAIAREWLAADERNEQILYPFLGGNEINNSANAEPLCWVINFWDWPEEKAASFPVPYELVKSKVKPVRDANKRKSRRNKWWIYGETAAGLYCAIGQGHNFSSDNFTRREQRPSLNQVIAISTGVTKYPAFTFLRSTYVYSNKLCVLADERFSTFAILTSDIHGVWAWAQKTSMGGDLHSLVYAHGNIFETFPFPVGFLEHGDGELEELGTRFFQARQSYIETQNKGLTKFYNEFHDSRKTDRELGNLRHIQGELNQLVCRLYGWRDIELACGFHEVGYLPDGQNVRFTITEAARLEVLRRLSKLNKARFEEQSQSSSKTRSAIASEASIVDIAFEDGLFAIGGGKA